MEKELWEYDTFQNPNILYIFNRRIAEYDMESAGLSLIKEYHLLSNDTIAKLDSIPTKEERNVKIGLIERKNKKLTETKKQAFSTARHEFMALNGLERNDIISIKKDAIFSIKKCKQQKIGKYINFREKNVYSSFALIGKRKVEIYYGDSHIDVKGISDDIVPLHDNGMNQFFISFFRRMEIDSRESILRFVRSTIDSYKKFDLPVDYYREFNPKSAFKTIEGEEMMDYWDEDKMDLDITYNYFILCNLCKILL